MLFSSSLVLSTLALLVSAQTTPPVSPSPPPSNTSTPAVPITPVPGPKKPNGYIVTLNPGVNKSAFLSQLNGQIPSFNDTDCKDTITYAGWDERLLNGFAGTFGQNAISALQSSKDVKAIEEDGMMRGFDAVQQTNAGWNLQRITQAARINGGPGSFNYVYSYDSSAGQGVDIYVLDTGISTTHAEFGGRARFGAAFPNTSTVDGNGHGTHCAGVAASARYGVAKRASLIAVKVLNDLNAGATSDLISGLNYVGISAQNSLRPSVVSASLGGAASAALDMAVGNLVDQGVHVVVAAGNDNIDASNTSPARSLNAVTVGASDIKDSRATYSNYGSVVDLFAPGTQVTSTWINGDQATAVLSGTSVATPHVAGVIAYLMGRYGYIKPSDMTAYLHLGNTMNVLSSIPQGTRNELLRLQN